MILKQKYLQKVCITGMISKDFTFESMNTFICATRMVENHVEKLLIFYFFLILNSSLLYSLIIYIMSKEVILQRRENGFSEARQWLNNNLQ